MEHFTYFAYGSNMLREWLLQRCPSAKAIGVAVASGYILEFSKKSKDKSGKATLVKSTEPKRQVFGALFEIGLDDRPKLDRAEGKGSGYDRNDVFDVTLLSVGTQAQVTTYIASASAVDGSLKPYDWYQALVIVGAEQHQLPEAYIASLREFIHIADQELNREGRKNAVEALKLAGVQDFTQVLKSPHTR